MRLRRKHTIQEYLEFEEMLAELEIETEEDFARAPPLGVGYYPSVRQRVFILARIKREKWTVGGKTRYVRVMRDKRGRFVKWVKWTWKKIRK